MKGMDLVVSRPFEGVYFYDMISHLGLQCCLIEANTDPSLMLLQHHSHAVIACSAFITPYERAVTSLSIFL